MREAERFLNKTMAEVDAGRVVAGPDTFASYVALAGRAQAADRGGDLPRLQGSTSSGG